MNYNGINLNKLDDFEEPKDKIVVFAKFVEENNNGEVISSHTTVYKKKYAKRGWSRMYHKDYAEAIIEVTRENSFATILFNYMLKNNYFKQDGSIKGFTQNKIAKELNTTRQRVSRAINVLKKNEMIEKYDGEWLYNPFLIYISGGSDEQIKKAQNKWRYLFGYSVTKEITEEFNNRRGKKNATKKF